MVWGQDLFEGVVGLANTLLPCEHSLHLPTLAGEEVQSGKARENACVGGAWTCLKLCQNNWAAPLFADLGA